MISEKCNKNISNKNFERLINYLSEMKEMDQIVLQKEFLVPITWNLCLTKRHLDNPEGQVKVASPLIRSYL